MPSIRDTTKARGRPATGKGAPVTLRLQPNLLHYLDAWIIDQPLPRPSRPEAVRRLLGIALNLGGTAIPVRRALEE